MTKIKWERGFATLFLMVYLFSCMMIDLHLVIESVAGHEPNNWLGLINIPWVLAILLAGFF